MKIRSLIVSLLIFLSFCLSGQENRLNFKVRINNEVSTNLARFSYFVLPGDTISVKAEVPLNIHSDDGQIIRKAGSHFLYIAPENKGYYKITFQEQESGETMTLLVFVMVPASELKNGYLNGYRIGTYPEENYKHKISYQKPKGFIEVTKENKDVFLTPHFQLKQFLCKEQGEWPKYVVIKPLILIKLEKLLDKLHENGINAKTMFLMSAYRTPYYNKAIGNVKYSRHQYGDAVDIYVDENLDGVIDDLNGDGISTIKDAEVIQQLVEQIEADPANKDLIGGMGKYKKTSAHTYFIHIDTRGYRARW
jgi:hypothetical protein